MRKPIPAIIPNTDPNTITAENRSDKPLGIFLRCKRIERGCINRVRNTPNAMGTNMDWSPTIPQPKIMRNTVIINAFTSRGEIFSCNFMVTVYHDEYKQKSLYIISLLAPSELYA